MADSIYPGALPGGYGAYLAYADGNWPTAAAVRRMFPTLPVVVLTVTGNTLECDGADVESEDLTIERGAEWARDKLDAGYARPVLYADVSNMAPLISALAAVDIPRNLVRLLSAHYGTGEHICVPDASHAQWDLPSAMDGTQWTNAGAGAGGNPIDISLLNSDFFGWTVQMMDELPTVQSGSTGTAVKTVQGLLIGRGCTLGTTGPRKNGVDGVFGAKTEQGVKAVQSAAGLDPDGVVGQQTWPALLAL